MENPEIKACPLCGHEAELRENVINEQMTIWGVSCKQCPCCVKKLFTDPAKAIHAWNTRAGDRQPVTPESKGTKAVGSKELLCLTPQDAAILRLLLGDLLHSQVWQKLNSRPGNFDRFMHYIWPKLEKLSDAEVRHNESSSPTAAGR